MYNKLKGLMAENNITQKDLAEELELNPSTLNFKINGKNEFTLTEAKKISGLFKKPIEEIFFIA